MRRRLALAIAGLCLVAAEPCQAKNDIRGVATTQPLRDALETLELDGAQCDPPARGAPTVCSYDDRTKMTLYAGVSPPNKVEKLVYLFYFKDIQKMRDKLQQLYGLQKGHIEGEHKQYNGERLEIELSVDGTRTLTITNDLQVKRNASQSVR